jgi:tetratricopeptide (TPR) repeat protein
MWVQKNNDDVVRDKCRLWRAFGKRQRPTLYLFRMSSLGEADMRKMLFPVIAIGLVVCALVAGCESSHTAVMEAGRRGLNATSVENWDAAIREFSEAIRLEPSDALNYGSRVVAYAKKGEFDKAIADFDEAIRLSPNDAKFYAARGTVYKLKGDANRANQDFAEAKRRGFPQGGGATGH